MSEVDPSATLASLSAAVTHLDSALAPLLAKPLADHLEHEQPLLQARAQVLASYVVHDLVWVYLKTAGVDPASHPVMAEIDRLKTYFSKLKGAQAGVVPSSSTSAAPAQQRRMHIDRQAASRFINAAIASQRATVDPAYEGDGVDPEAGPSGTHTRFSGDEGAGEGASEGDEDEGAAPVDAEVDRLLEAEPADDEVEVEGGAADEAVVLSAGAGASYAIVEEASTPAKAPAKGKGKGKAVEGGKKRKSLDPFAGYDEPKPSTPRPAAGAKKANPPSSSAAKRQRTSAPASPAPAASAPDSGASTPTGAAKGKQGKGKKGAAAAAEGEGERVSKNQKKKLRMKAAQAAEGQ
ncbi:hypothetical protein JCM9279_005745 [Rhodotorula babjevae]